MTLRRGTFTCSRRSTRVNWRALVDTVRTIVRIVREEHITFMAGSIAHSAFLSLLPLLLLLLVITAAVGNQTINDEVAALAQDYLSPTGEELLYSALTDATDRAGASVVGVATLLWGMLRVFRGLNTAFDELYGDRSTGLLRTTVEGVIVFVAIVVATVGTAVGVAVLALVDETITQVLTPVVLLLGLTAAFYPLYYLLPEPDLAYLEAVPGTVVAACGWALLEVVFGYYVDLVNTDSTFGLLGSVIILLVWLYAIAFVLLVGAVVDVVLAGRHRDATAPDTDEGSTVVGS